MTKKPDGGPAFPWPESLDYEGWGGMSLRDWFAGQALMGIMASENDYDYGKHLESNAAVSYAQADAMLAERDNGK